MVKTTILGIGTVKKSFDKREVPVEVKRYIAVTMAKLNNGEYKTKEERK